MTRTIEIYIINKEVITQKSLEGRQIQGHYCTVKEISTTEKIIPDEDKAVLQLARRLIYGKDFKIQVIDVASLKGQLSAKLKGVKVTPTIIVGSNRLVGVPSEGEFKAALEQ